MKIKGITIDLGVNTKPVTKGFQEINQSLKQTDRTLKDIDKGLKFDPGNIELLRQKTVYLKQAIDQTNKKLEEEQKVLDQLEKQQKENTDSSKSYQEQIDAVKREMESTRQAQEKYQNALEETKTQTENASKANKQLEDSFFTASLKSDLLIKGVELAGQAVGKLVGFVADAVKASSEFADTILTESTVTGLSTDALQEYYYMAELVDVSVDTITGSMAKLTKQMYAAKDGTGSAAEYFEQLGVSVTDAQGNLRDNNEVFDEIITKLADVENETERDAIAMGIFGKSAQDLNPLIAQGADNLQAFRDEAHEMGYVLDEDALTALGAVDDAFQRSSLVLDSVMNQIGGALAPIIVDIANKFMEWAQSVNWEELGAKISAFVSGAVEVIQAVIPVIQWIIGVIVAAFQVYWSFMEDLYNFVKTVWDGIPIVIQQAKDAISPIIDTIVEIFQKVWDVVQKVIDKVGEFVGAISGAISSAGDFFSGVGGRISGFFGGLFSSGGFDNFTAPSFASGGYNLSTSVTINNYATPVTGAFADRVASIVNAKLGSMLK